MFTLHVDLKGGCGSCFWRLVVLEEFRGERVSVVLRTDSSGERSPYPLQGVNHAGNATCEVENVLTRSLHSR